MCIYDGISKCGIFINCSMQPQMGLGDDVIVDMILCSHTVWILGKKIYASKNFLKGYEIIEVLELYCDVRSNLHPWQELCTVITFQLSI